MLTVCMYIYESSILLIDNVLHLVYTSSLCLRFYLAPTIIDLLIPRSRISKLTAKHAAEDPKLIIIFYLNFLFFLNVILYMRSSSVNFTLFSSDANECQLGFEEFINERNHIEVGR